MSALKRHYDLTAIWRNEPGWRGYLRSVNHSDIGKRFIVAAFAFFAIGGVLAMLIRAQLATPRSAFVGPEVYNQLFTMHGSIMMFLFASSARRLRSVGSCAPCLGVCSGG